MSCLDFDVKGQGHSKSNMVRKGTWGILKVMGHGFKGQDHGQPDGEGIPVDSSPLRII